MKNKKLTALLVSLCLIFNLFPVMSFAESWDGTTKIEPDKNENGEYVITSAEELAPDQPQ